jgi:hypothetical protein
MRHRLLGFNTAKNNKILRVKKEPILCQSFGLLIRSGETPLVEFLFYVGTLLLLCFVFGFEFSPFSMSRDGEHQ